MISNFATLRHTYDSPSGKVSYLLFQPEEIFFFSEGQFVMIETLIEDQIVKKPYSIATTNRMLQEEKLIGVIVKKASTNGMSDWLTSKIALGDTVTLKGPAGHYTDPKTQPNYLLISTGSGLSPNFGLFQHLVYEQKLWWTLVHLFWERYEEDLIPQIITNLHESWLPNIHTFTYLSGEDNSYVLYRMWHVQDGLQEAVNLVGNSATCFVCGKPAMVTDVIEKLQGMGIPREQIVVEKY